MKSRTEIRQDRLGFWIWAIFADDGTTIRQSRGGHASRRLAELHLQRALRWLAGGDVDAGATIGSRGDRRAG